MTPQQLHDLWLILTVVATLEISAIAVYLWRMFRFSSRRWFFWTLAAVFAAIAVDQTTQEVKNLAALPPPNVGIAWTWLIGRIVVVVVAGIGLGYIVFGRNGKQPVVTPPAPTEN